MANFDRARATQLAEHIKRLTPTLAAELPPEMMDKGKARSTNAERVEALKTTQAKLEKAKILAQNNAEKVIAAIPAPASQAGPSQTPEEKTLAILRLQLRQLKLDVARHQTAATTVSSSFFLGAPPQLSEAKARKLLEEQVAEHEKAETVDRELLEEAEEELALAKRLLDEVTAMKAGLLVRSTTVEAQKSLTPKDLVLIEARKADQAEESWSRIQAQMVDFIDQLGDDGTAGSDEEADEPKEEPRVRRGPPRPIDFLADVRRLGNPDVFSTLKARKKKDLPSTAKSGLLKSLLQRLMNASMMSPTDPWIDVLSPPRPAGREDDEDLPPGGLGMPPPLVNYLIRAGIAVEHRLDPRKVKLVEFWRGVKEPGQS